MLPLFGPIAGGFEFLLFGLIGLLIAVGAAYWVYQDATSRGNGNAAVWAGGVLIAGVFLNLLGLLIVLGLYVVVGR